jgi:hypothetical protein
LVQEMALEVGKMMENDEDMMKNDENMMEK